MEVFKNKVPLMDGKPHKITGLIKKYILQNNSLNTLEEDLITPTAIDRAVCDIIAHTLGINKGLLKNLNVPGPKGLKQRDFNLEVLKGIKSELAYSEERFKFLWKRTQDSFEKSNNNSGIKLAKPKGRKARRLLKN